MESSKYQKQNCEGNGAGNEARCEGSRGREKTVGRAMATNRAVRYAMLIALALAFPTVTAGV